jgi:predicted DNA-binding transcriptional regulator AlpA
MNDITTNESEHIPDLMTEEEVVQFLRIPEVSKAKDYHNVIYTLIRFRDFPRIHISNKLLFPRKAILEWVV